MAVTQVKNGYQGGSDDQLKVNPDGSIDINVVGPVGDGNVNIHDSAGGTLNSTNGALDVAIQGLNEFQTSGYAVGVTPVHITPTPLVNRSSVGLKAVCTTGEVIYIGNSNAVTSANGWPLFDGDALEIDITGVQAIWAIGSSAGQYLYAIEAGD